MINDKNWKDFTKLICLSFKENMELKKFLNKAVEFQNNGMIEQVNSMQTEHEKLLLRNGITSLKIAMASEKIQISQIDFNLN